MTASLYASGEQIELGDVVDMAGGLGKRATVVVLISSGLAAKGFKADEWAYLKSGFMLQTDDGSLLHYPEPDDDLVFICRA